MESNNEIKSDKKGFISKIIGGVLLLCFIVGVIAAFLSIPKTDDGGSGDKAPPKKDPLYDYVLEEKKEILPQQHFTLVEHLTLEQKQNLWRTLKGKPDTELPNELDATLLNRELQWVSSHWITFIANKNETADYNEIVRWTANKLDVPKAECKYATVFQLEHAICEKIFARVWDKLTPEQRKKVLEESGVGTSNAAGMAALSGAGVLAATGTATALGGFGFYILMAKTVAVAAAAVGVPVTTTISAIALLGGPVGWTIAGISAVTGALLIGRADVSRTAAYITQIHMFKVLALKNSGVEYEKYLLKRN